MLGCLGVFLSRLPNKCDGTHQRMASPIEGYTRAIRVCHPEQAFFSTMISTYKIDGKLMQTQSAVISFAWIDGADVVLKTVRDKKLAENEAATLSKISDVNNCQRLLNHFENSEGESVLVFPLLTEVRFKKLNLIDIRKYMDQLCSVLYDVHNLGIAHLDLTPSNIMQNSAGQLVIIDWALSRPAGPDNRIPHPPSGI